MFVVYEMCGNDGFRLDEFDTFEEASDFMIECAGNDVTREYGDDILENDEQYMIELENALNYYSIDEEE